VKKKPYARLKSRSKGGEEGVAHRRNSGKEPKKTKGKKGSLEQSELTRGSAARGRALGEERRGGVLGGGGEE